MSDGLKAGFYLVLFILGILLSVLIYKVVGFFISGSLGQAATASSFDNGTINNITAARTTFASQVSSLDASVTIMIALVIVVVIVSVFSFILYIRKKGNKSGGGDMPY